MDCTDPALKFGSIFHQDGGVIFGATIPGLSVAARELPRLSNVLALENPEVGGGVRIGRDYTLEEVAELHVATLREHDRGEELALCGYSMGGMILAIMASLFRSKLPRKTRFYYLMTSAGGIDLPSAGAIREGTEEEWARAVAPYFSPEFIEKQPLRFAAYVRYRAFGLNNQSGEALFRQLWAMQRCRPAEYFARTDGAESTFIGSRGDRIFGAKANSLLAALCPGARHIELDHVGHMVHHERPEVIRDIYSPDRPRVPNPRRASTIRPRIASLEHAQ